MNSKLLSAASIVDLGTISPDCRLRGNESLVRGVLHFFGRFDSEKLQRGDELDLD